MKQFPSKEVESGRVTHTQDKVYGTTAADGCNGAFLLWKEGRPWLRILATDGKDKEAADFEHVSVSLDLRTPTWEEMAWVKDQFWEEHEACFQLHPSRSEYVNYHPYCLHIWRHRVFPIPMPPSVLVGPKRGR